MTNIFYTSDTHVGHKLVAKERGFFTSHPQTGEFGLEVDVPNTEAHDGALADMWDSTVRKDDIVFVLGDISINGGQYALDWHADRPGTKVLISGNHDKVHPFHRDSYKHFQKWSEVFTGGIFPFFRRKLVGKYFLMSHFPYTGTGSEGHGDEERMTQFRLPDMGVPLLHGHTHLPVRSHVSDQGTRQLHVGLDAWGMKLVPQEAVMEWLAEG